MTVYAVIYFGLGMVMGLALLPWKKQLFGASDSMGWWLLGWLFYWPYLVVIYLWVGIDAYRRGWRRYQQERQAAKWHAEHGQKSSDQ